MQEHIRRAHPEHYISKLPATEESFLLMINTPPSDRRHLDQSPASASHNRLYRDDGSTPGTPRIGEDKPGDHRGSMLGTASAAAALAELHNIKGDKDLELNVRYPTPQPTTHLLSIGISVIDMMMPR
jgi:hypothetical protein